MRRSFFTYFRLFYQRARAWRYRTHPETAKMLDFADFTEYGQELLTRYEFNPLFVTQEGVYVKSSKGVYFLFDPQKQHGKLWGVENGLDWEPGVINLCEKILRHKAGICFDIGANIGLFSITLAHNVPDVVFHAFEPIPDNYCLLIMNVKENGLEDRIIPKEYALSNCASTAVMSNMGQLSHFVIQGQETASSLVEVKTITIDEYCFQQSLKNITLIKCDVEGLELKVLQGAYNVLKNQKPVLMLEIASEWLARYQSTGHEIFSYLESLGYSGRAILENGELGDMNLELDVKLAQGFNFLFQCKELAQ